MSPTVWDSLHISESLLPNPSCCLAIASDWCFHVIYRVRTSMPRRFLWISFIAIHLISFSRYDSFAKTQVRQWCGDIVVLHILTCAFCGLWGISFHVSCVLPGNSWNYFWSKNFRELRSPHSERRWRLVEEEYRSLVVLLPRGLVSHGCSCTISDSLLSYVRVDSIL